MRQTKRVVNKIFPVILLVLLSASTIVYVEGDMVKPFFSSIATQRRETQEKNSYAKRLPPVEKELPIMVESSNKSVVVSLPTSSVKGKKSDGCPNPGGTCVSPFVNSYLFDEADAVKYEDISYKTNNVTAFIQIGKEDPNGGQMHFCTGEDRQISLTMKLMEAPILPNYYKNGIQKGLLVREADGKTSGLRAYVPQSAQEVRVDQIPDHCSNNDLFRTEATYGIEPKLGTNDATWFKGSPFGWKACAAKSNTDIPNADASAWGKYKQIDESKKFVAYKMGWASDSSLPVEGSTTGIYGSYGWAFDPPGNSSLGAEAGITQVFDINTPPSPETDSDSPRNQLLSRTTMSLDFVSKSVLDIIFSGHGYVFPDNSSKNSNVRLSYNPTSQQSSFCNYRDGTCPLVPATVSCKSLVWLNITARPGILQMSTTPDYLTNASNQKAMQRAMNLTLNSFNPPDSIFEKATKDDIILAAANKDWTQGNCSALLHRSSNLTDEEFQDLKDYYKYNSSAKQSVAGGRDKGAALFYKIKASFEGDVDPKFLGMMAHANFDGEVIAFTVIPIQHLTEYMNFHAPNEEFKEQGVDFRNTVLKETGFDTLKYTLKCNGNDVEISFDNIH